MVGRSQLEDDIREVSSAYVQHEPVDVHFDEAEGRTRQEFADECDINNIMARYEKTGVINHYNQREPMYLDFTEIPDDLHSALLQLEDAKRAFMTLPAQVRAEFDNDPVQFVTFAADPDNLGQMREWGLAPPAPVQDPSPEPAAPAPGAPEPPLSPKAAP